MIKPTFKVQAQIFAKDTDIRQASSINIFEPPPNTLPSGLICSLAGREVQSPEPAIADNSNSSHAVRTHQVARRQFSNQKQSEKGKQSEQQATYFNMCPPSIEYIVIENQLNEQRNSLPSNQLKIQQLFANKEPLSSQVFSTEKMTKMLQREEKDAGKGSTQQNRIILPTLYSRQSETDTPETQEALERQRLLQEKIPSLQRTISDGAERAQLDGRLLQVQEKLRSQRIENEQMQQILTVLSRQQSYLPMPRSQILKGKSIDLNLLQFLLKSHPKLRGTIRQ